jgi:hypothetical protein
VKVEPAVADAKQFTFAPPKNADVMSVAQ